MLSSLTVALNLIAVSTAFVHLPNHEVAKRQTTIVAAAAATTSATATTSNAATPAAATGSPTVVDGITVPALAAISMGMTSGVTLPATATYTPGTSPSLSGAPALPSTFVFNPADWPAQDKTPPTDSAEVQGWLKELDGHDIPNISQTVDGTCASDAANAANATARGWWTCGGTVRDTDIVACPDKLTWGVSFDDGPAPYSETLLKYLSSKNLLATFFVVGSRVIERPDILLEEYMTGHEISVHTWSHPHLTTLTNEQIVAELGWTRQAIKTVLGVTPTTMRCPYGDLDDRVRAISLAMGLIPIQWTRSPSGSQFDTNDWKVAGGLVAAPDSLAQFKSILSNATTLDTGFIVLQHDLFEVTVDLAVGYTLNAALAFTPTLKLEPIGQCSKIPTTNLYLETNKNGSFPYPSSNGSTGSTPGSSSTGGSSSGSSSGNSAASISSSVLGLFFGLIVTAAILI